MKIILLIIHSEPKRSGASSVTYDTLTLYRLLGLALDVANKTGSNLLNRVENKSILLLRLFSPSSPASIHGKAKEK